MAGRAGEDRRRLRHRPGNPAQLPRQQSLRANKKDDLNAAWAPQAPNSRPGAQRTRRNEPAIRGVHRGNGQLLRRHLGSPAGRPLLVQPQVKHRSENKEGRVPTHNLAEDLTVGDNLGKGNQRAERKRAKRLRRLLAPNNTNLVWDTRRPRNNPGPFWM
jgi:hypothetical protein